MQSSYRLFPFQPCDFNIECQLTEPKPEPKSEKSANPNRFILEVEYCLTGELSAIKYPPATARPGRKWNLWEHSCLECFVARAGAPAYYEINLSPSGDWNTYHFSSTRKDMQEATNLCVENQMFDMTQNETNQLSAALVFDDGAPGDNLEINLSAVIEDMAGQFHYFALEHPEKRPDFHNRQTFMRIERVRLDK